VTNDEGMTKEGRSSNDLRHGQGSEFGERQP